MLVETFLLLCLLVLLLYIKITRGQTFWASQGVQGPKPRFPFGSNPFMCKEALSQ